MDIFVANLDKEKDDVAFDSIEVEVVIPMETSVAKEMAIGRAKDLKDLLGKERRKGTKGVTFHN